jgi:hypothetical protein
MQTKKRESIEKADMSLLSHIMRKEIESLYKLNKVNISELFFNLFVSINLKLHNSSGSYLKELLEATNQYFRARNIVVLSKSEDEVCSYSINVKTGGTSKEKSRCPIVESKFDELWEKASAGECTYADLADVNIFDSDDDEVIAEGSVRVFPIVSSLKFIQNNSTPLIGLWIIDESEIQNMGEEIWEL